MAKLLVDGARLLLEPNSGPWSWSSGAALDAPIHVEGAKLTVEGASVVFEADIATAITQATVNAAYKHVAMAAPGTVASVSISINASTLARRIAVDGSAPATEATVGTFTIQAGDRSKNNTESDPVGAHRGRWRVAAPAQRKLSEDERGPRAKTADTQREPPGPVASAPLASAQSDDSPGLRLRLALALLQGDWLLPWLSALQRLQNPHSGPRLRVDVAAAVLDSQGRYHLRRMRFLTKIDALVEIGSSGRARVLGPVILDHDIGVVADRTVWLTIRASPVAGPLSLSELGETPVLVADETLPHMMAPAVLPAGILWPKSAEGWITRIEEAFAGHTLGAARAFLGLNPDEQPQPWTLIEPILTYIVRTTQPKSTTTPTLATEPIPVFLRPRYPTLLVMAAATTGLSDAAEDIEELRLARGPKALLARDIEALLLQQPLVTEVGSQSLAKCPTPQDVEHLKAAIAEVAEVQVAVDGARAPINASRLYLLRRHAELHPRLAKLWRSTIETAEQLETVDLDRALKEALRLRLATPLLALDVESSLTLETSIKPTTVELYWRVWRARAEDPSWRAAEIPFITLMGALLTVDRAAREATATFEAIREKFWLEKVFPLGLLSFPLASRLRLDTAISVVNRWLEKSGAYALETTLGIVAHADIMAALNFELSSMKPSRAVSLARGSFASWKAIAAVKVAEIAVSAEYLMVYASDGALAPFLGRVDVRRVVPFEGAGRIGSDAELLLVELRQASADRGGSAKSGVDLFAASIKRRLEIRYIDPSRSVLDQALDQARLLTTIIDIFERIGAARNNAAVRLADLRDAAILGYSARFVLTPSLFDLPGLSRLRGASRTQWNLVITLLSAAASVSAAMAAPERRRLEYTLSALSSIANAIGAVAKIVPRSGGATGPAILASFLLAVAAEVARMLTNAEEIREVKPALDALRAAVRYSAFGKGAIPLDREFASVAGPCSWPPLNEAVHSPEAEDATNARAGITTALQTLLSKVRLVELNGDACVVWPRARALEAGSRIDAVCVQMPIEAMLSPEPPTILFEPDKPTAFAASFRVTFEADEAIIKASLIGGEATSWIDFFPLETLDGRILGALALLGDDAAGSMIGVTTMCSMHSPWPAVPMLILARPAGWTWRPRLVLDRSRENVYRDPSNSSPLVLNYKLEPNRGVVMLRNPPT
jgi:hypothetical protein